MADPSGSGEPVPAPTSEPQDPRWNLTPEQARAMAQQTVERWTKFQAHGYSFNPYNGSVGLARAYLRDAASPGGEPPTPSKAVEALDRIQDACSRDLAEFWMTEDFATVRAALGSARPPLPPQEISPEMVEAAWRAWYDLDESSNPATLKSGPAWEATSARWRIALAAALRVRGEPSRSKVLVCPDCDGTEHVAGSDGATPFCVECEDVEMGWTYRRRATDHEPEAVRGEPSREPTLEEVLDAAFEVSYHLVGITREEFKQRVRARLSSLEAPR